MAPGTPDKLRMLSSLHGQVHDEAEELDTLLDDLGHWIDTQLVATSAFVVSVIEARERVEEDKPAHPRLSKAS